MAEIPSLIYGTAWKELETEALTCLALRTGLRAIDTANQRKHYFEEGVGAALSQFWKSGHRRQDIFLQTKFTFVRGQDHRLPYDPQSPISQQVADSFKKSLEHLQTDYLDAYILHGPWSHRGYGSEDRQAWQAMEALATQGVVQALGVSNVSLQQLEMFYSAATIKPQFVQNRCFAVTGWDRDVRNFCREHKIRYQGFSLLTANTDWIQGPLMEDLSQKYSTTTASLVFAFAYQSEMIALTGSTDPEHLTQDLGASHLAIEPGDLMKIENIAFL